MPNLSMEAKAARSQRQMREHAMDQTLMQISDTRRESKAHSQAVVDLYVSLYTGPITKSRARKANRSLASSEAGRLMRQEREDFADKNKGRL